MSNLAGYVERGALPGLIALVARGDDVQVDVLGTKALGDTGPMPRDAIFRIASLTKPVTAAAAMILADDGVYGTAAPAPCGVRTAPVTSPASCSRSGR